MNLHLKKQKNVVEKVKNPNSRWQHFKDNSFDMFSKLSKAFLLPIALLPLAGIFIGVGSTITGQVTEGTSAYIFGNLLSTIGSIPFNNLGLLFAIAIAIAYTKNSGVAGLTAVVNYLVFNVFVTVFLVTASTNADGEAITYNLWFWKNLDASIFTSTLGMMTLSTSVFGGLVVGAITAIIFNKFHKTQLPSVLSFFSGDRLVPIIAVFTGMLLSCIFILIWPAVGKGLSFFGKWAGTLPIGLNSFIFGIFNRLLEIFGLHHAFYMPFWMSSVGGSIGGYETAIMQIGMLKFVPNDLINQVKELGTNMSPQALLDAYKDLVGADSSIWHQFYDNWFMKIGSGGGINDAFWKLEGDQTLYTSIMKDSVLKLQDVWGAGLRVGQYLNGEYSLFMYAFPCIMLAFYLNVPKGNRKAVFGIYASAALSEFVVGISEPIEFIILFANPWLFFGILVPLNGLNFMFMNIMQVKIGVIFSSGLLDFILYAILPTINGNDTQLWWAVIFGLGWSAIMFPLYYFILKYKKITIPGRSYDKNSTDAIDLGKIESKEDLKDQMALGKKKLRHLDKDQSPNESNLNENIQKAKDIIIALGGKENLVDVDACTTRLRVQVNDHDKVNKELLKETGSLGIIDKNTRFQVVYGVLAQTIKEYVLEELEKQNWVS